MTDRKEERDKQRRAALPGARLPRERVLMPPERCFADGADAIKHSPDCPERPM